MAQRNFERGEQAEVLAVHIFGPQTVVTQNIDRERIVGDHALQAQRQQRQRFIQAERIAQVLRQFKEVLHFLARRGDGRQEVLCRFRSGGAPGALKSGPGLQAALDLDVGRKLGRLHFARRRHGFQLDITALQHLHHLGIEGLPGFGRHLAHGFVERQRPPVLAVRSERVQAIHRRQNARANRNAVALQPVRISSAIPALVMRPHDGSHRVGKAHALQNFGAHHRVDLHLLELFAGQLSGFRDDVLGHRQLSDVVQHRGRAQRFQLRFVQAQFLAHLHRVDLHALQMIVRGVILGLDGQRESFDGSQVQRRHLLGVLLLVLHPAQIEVIGAVDQIYDGDGQQRGLPAEMSIDGAGRAHDQRAQQIIGERPDVAFAPDVAAETGAR